MSIAIKAAGGTHPGRVRQHNEDAFYPDPKDGTVDPTPIGRGGHLFIVADGVGGNRGGARASQIAVGRVPAFYYGTVNGDPGRALRQAFDSAAHEIVAEGAANPDRANMSCTIVAAVVQGNQATIAHLGDARAYLLRDGALRPLTRDHTWVQMQVEKGTLTEAEAENHPDRNVITRSLGNPSFPEADVTQIALQAGDRLLLCSDGLCGVAGDAEMAAVLNRAAGPTAAVQPLIELANRKGGPDNVTALVVQYGQPVVAAPRRSAVAPLLALLVLAAVMIGAFLVFRPAAGGGARAAVVAEASPAATALLAAGEATAGRAVDSAAATSTAVGVEAQATRILTPTVTWPATQTSQAASPIPTATPVAVFTTINTAIPTVNTITLTNPQQTNCPPPPNSPQYSGNRLIDFSWRMDGAPAAGSGFSVRVRSWNGQWRDYGDVRPSDDGWTASVPVGIIYEDGADQYQWQVAYFTPGQGEVTSPVSCFRITGGGGGGPAATEAPKPTAAIPPTVQPPPTNTPDADSDGVPDSQDECPNEDAGNNPDPNRPGCPKPTP